MPAQSCGRTFSAHTRGCRWGFPTCWEVVIGKGRALICWCLATAALTHPALSPWKNKENRDHHAMSSQKSEMVNLLCIAPSDTARNQQLPLHVWPGTAHVTQTVIYSWEPGAIKAAEMVSAGKEAGGRGVGVLVQVLLMFAAPWAIYPAKPENHLHASLE